MSYYAQSLSLCHSFPHPKALFDCIGGIVEDVEARMMIGTVGLFAGDQQFGVLDDDQLYLPVDGNNRDDFAEAGTEPYSAASVEGASSLQVPEGAIEDEYILASWMERSLEAAS
jgi:TfoX/Sxy family transcriptional regulator of competence genes